MDGSDSKNLSMAARGAKQDAPEKTEQIGTKIGMGKITIFDPW